MLVSNVLLSLPLVGGALYLAGRSTVLLGSLRRPSQEGILSKSMRRTGTIILIALLIMLFLLIRKIFWYITVLTSPLFMLSIMIFILGFQSILMGLIAEMLVRTYHESQGKTVYHIGEMINFNDEA